MHSTNRVVLVGRLTRDPELAALPSGKSVCNLRIACNSSHKDPQSGDWSERPNYFDVSVYGPPGENVATYMRRGRLVAIDGRLSWREWETADEQKRQAVSIVADSVQFLEGPGGRDQADAGADEDGDLVGAGAREDDLSF
jgi:single-strand DNA-binding protein